MEDKRNFNTTLNIGKYPDELVDLKTGEVLGEKVSYVYFGGWFFKYTGFNVEGCDVMDIQEGLEVVRIGIF